MTDARGGASEPEPFCEDVSGVRLPDAGPSLFACGLKESEAGARRCSTPGLTFCVRAQRQ